MWAEAQMYRWKGELQFDTRKSSSHDPRVICSLREQFIHHSAHCWQFAVPGELIWWQQPALSCHFYQGWKACSYHAELIALAWRHACTQIGACLRWGRDSHQEQTRAINLAVKKLLVCSQDDPRKKDLTALRTATIFQPLPVLILQWHMSLSWQQMKFWTLPTRLAIAW